jgi:hypothetical protein
VGTKWDRFLGKAAAQAVNSQREGKQRLTRAHGPAQIWPCMWLINVHFGHRLTHHLSRVLFASVCKKASLSKSVSSSLCEQLTIPITKPSYVRDTSSKMLHSFLYVHMYVLLSLMEARTVLKQIFFRIGNMINILASASIDACGCPLLQSRGLTNHI